MLGTRFKLEGTRILENFGNFETVSSDSCTAVARLESEAKEAAVLESRTLAREEEPSQFVDRLRNPPPPVFLLELNTLEPPPTGKCSNKLPLEKIELSDVYLDFLILDDELGVKGVG